MKYLASTPSNHAVVEISDDALLTLHACIRETLEALSNPAELRIRVGVEAGAVEALMVELRTVRSALSSQTAGSASDG